MIYLYRCNQCNHEFERDLKLEQVINHAKLPKFACPKCHGTTRKLINKPAIQFKGAGFYSTDNKKGE